MLFHIYEQDNCSIKGLEHASGLSHRGFYINFNKLLEAELVHTTQDSADKRKRMAALTDAGRVLVEEIFGRLRPSTAGEV